jgi:hypothetical protein
MKAEIGPFRATTNPAIGYGTVPIARQSGMDSTTGALRRLEDDLQRRATADCMSRREPASPG